MKTYRNIATVVIGIAGALCLSNCGTENGANGSDTDQVLSPQQSDCIHYNINESPALDLAQEYDIPTLNVNGLIPTAMIHGEDQALHIRELNDDYPTAEIYDPYTAALEAVPYETPMLNADDFIPKSNIYGNNPALHASEFYNDFPALDSFQPETTYLEVVQYDTPALKANDYIPDLNIYEEYPTLRIHDPQINLNVNDKQDSELDETVTVTYADGRMSVKHHNACNQCGFSFKGTFEKNENEVEINENDASVEQADCVCFFDLSYSVPVENPETVQLLILDSDGNIVIDEELDMASQTEFKFNLGENGCAVMAE